MDFEEFRDFFKTLTRPDEAGIVSSSVDAQKQYNLMTIPLDTATTPESPLKIAFPFRSVFVVDATGVSDEVFMRVGGRDLFYDRIPLRLNYTIKFPYPVKEAYLDWISQPGETISLLFFLRGEFATNSILGALVGGVSLYYGTQITTLAGESVTSTASKLFSTDFTRKMMLIHNQSGLSIYVGDINVTAKGGSNPGFEIPPGGQFEWLTEAACYAVTAGGSTGASDISLTKFA